MSAGILSSVRPASVAVRPDSASGAELEECLAALQREDLSLVTFAGRCRDWLGDLLAQLRADVALRSVLEAEGLEGDWQVFGQDWQLNLLLCSDERMAQWNWQFRGQNQATDILSFPSFSALALPGAQHCEPGGGDLLLSLRSWLANCRDFACDPEEELQRLLLHGVLHLLGLDHSEGESLGSSGGIQSNMLLYQENLLKEITQRSTILPR